MFVEGVYALFAVSVPDFYCFVIATRHNQTAIRRKSEMISQLFHSQPFLYGQLLNAVHSF